MEACNKSLFLTEVTKSTITPKIGVDCLLVYVT